VKHASERTWLARVKSGKAYVLLHLMPVYAFPELFDGSSRDVKNRMQGKSRFNTTRPDPAPFNEVGTLFEQATDLSSGETDR
jgi:hypothetical protein